MCKNLLKSKPQDWWYPNYTCKLLTRKVYYSNPKTLCKNECKLKWIQLELF